MKKPVKAVKKSQVKRAPRPRKVPTENLNDQGFQSALWAEMVIVGIIGFILSIVFHELFHILMHLDDLPRIGLFPQGHGAIVEVLVSIPQGYDLEGEEIGAYAITLLTLMITVSVLFRMRDSRDKRSAAQILFPDDKKMQKLSPAELLKMTEKAEPGLTTLIPQNQKKKRR